MSHPCPCGSGRELARCCSEPILDPELQYTSAERERALVKMQTLSARPTLRRFGRNVAEIFWAEALPEDDDEDAARAVLGDPNLQTAFLYFTCWDTNPHGEQPLAELLFEEQSKRLSRGERAYLCAGLESYWGLYEVLESRPGEGVLVQDLWRPRRLWVEERTASKQLVRFDVIGGRILKRPRGPHEFEGDLLDLTQRHKAALLAFVHELHDEELISRPELPDRVFFKIVLPDLVAWWVHEVATQPPLPRITTPEGDEFLLCRASFRVREREAFVRALDFATDLRRPSPDALEWSWIEPHGSAERVLGRLELRDDELAVETTSAERLARLRTYLAQIAEGHLAFVEASEQSAAELMEEERRPEPAREELPLEVQREVITRMMDEHYRAWLDERIPMLDGWTPRRAVHEPRMRARVVELLKGIANLEEQKRRRGEISYDSKWMWRELGLESEGASGASRGREPG
ncbi:MAG: SEC-C domain-containing protein [Planctomycetes bacterium]|nr:SEC-C domain-containing protein [Planctomycetota bacterium]